MSTTETKTSAPNTQAPKTEANPFAAFTSFAPFGASFDPMAAWTKMVTESTARMHAFAEQYAGLEAQMMTRASGAVATWAQMTQDALAYTTQLSTEARKLGFDAIKKFSAAA